MNNIDDSIYTDMLKRVSDLMLEEIQNKISSGILTEEKRNKYLTLLQEGYFEKIYNILQYIKKNLLYIIFGAGDQSNPEVSQKIDEIKQNYNIICNDFESLQNNSEATEEDKNKLRERINELKQAVIEVKNMKEQIPETSEDTFTPNPQSVPDSNIDMSQYTTPRGTESVGRLTASVDVASTFVWRKHWKKRCGGISGRKLNQCKSRGVDLAIGLIKSKLRLCNNTVDPDGCKQTLNNMINTWNEKKREYLKY